MTCVRRYSLLAVLILLAAWASAQSDSKPPAIRTIYPTFTTIDVPGAGYTGVLGINKAGDMVGNYGTNTETDSHGFLYSNGTFTYFDYPGATVTVASGINDSGLIVGHAGEAPVVGFLYDNGTFTTIKDGSDNATFTVGINNVGDIVGSAGSIYSTKGVELIGSRFKTLNVPGQYVYVSGTGINNRNEIVGWTDTTGFKCLSGKCQTFMVPGATQTEGEGVNDAGVIVGWYNPSSATDYAFVLQNGRYVSFIYPGAVETAALGINASGQVVGEYTFDYQSYHGFVTSPITAADFGEDGNAR
jgi:probable HAF family extracellular repeat protein